MPIAIQTGKQPWLRRPSGPVQIDWSSPLAIGLVAVLEIGPGGLSNIVRPALASATTTATPYGLGWPATGSSAVSDTTSPARTYNDFTACAWLYGSSSALYQGLLSTRSGGMTGWTLMLRVYPTVHVGVSLWDAAADPDYSSGLATPNDAGLQFIALARSGTSASWRVNKETATTTVSGVANVPTYAGYAVGTQHRNNGNGDYLATTSVYLTATVHTRALPPAELWYAYDPRTRWSLYAPLVRRTYVDVGGGAGSQTLTGDAAVSTWAVAGALSVGAVALVGSTPTAAWTVPSGTLAAGAVALSGAPAAAAWTVPAQALAPGAVALSGTPAASAWTVEAQPLAAGSAALSGAAAVSAWTVPTGALSAGDAPQALAGDPAVASWTVPVGAVTAGSVALSGAAAASAWAVPAQVLTPGAVALTGTPAVATWTVPSGDVTQAGATLTGDPAVSTWGISGVWSIAPVTLVGSPASSTWTLPTGTWPFSVLARRLRVLLASRSRARLGASRTRARIRASQD